MLNKKQVMFVGLLLMGITFEAQAEKAPAWTPEDNTKAIEEAQQGWWKDVLKTRDQRLEWWRKARFGCFVHWNGASLPGGIWKGKKNRGYAEHLQRQFKITQEEYTEGVIKKFNPTEFDPQEWAQLIREAGMKYVVITAKHHDGFAMYDSKCSDYNVVDATPYGKDPMRLLSKACRDEGLRFGFYYSHAFDWGEPYGAGNDWEFNRPGGDRGLHSNGNGRQWWMGSPELVPELHEKYVLKKAIPQILELVEGYQPDLIWFDTPHKLPASETLPMLKELRKASPSVIVNSRMVYCQDDCRYFGDYLSMGDRADDFRKETDDWETIPTSNESYGYKIHDKNYKTPGYMVQLIARTVSLNGNVLMNIGPMGNGEFCDEDKALLEGIGKWFKVYGDAIYETGESGLPPQSWGVTTAKGNIVYLHVFDWPKDGRLVVGGVQGELIAAELMGTDTTVPVKRQGDDLHLSLPKQAPDEADSVIQLFFKWGYKPVDRPQILAQDHPHELRVFHADEIGTGFSYGDGKLIPSRNWDFRYAADWKSDDQGFQWNTRLLSSQRYRVTARYHIEKKAPKDAASVLKFGEQILRFTPTNSTDGGATMQDLGIIELLESDITVQWRCEGLNGRALIRPILVQLAPVSE